MQLIKGYQQNVQPDIGDDVEQMIEIEQVSKFKCVKSGFVSGDFAEFLNHLVHCRPESFRVIPKDVDLATWLLERWAYVRRCGFPVKIYENEALA